MTSVILARTKKNAKGGTMEKKGIVKFISTKTSGVVLVGEDKVWYNPAQGVVVDPTLKGQKVIMQMLDKNRFTSIELDRTNKVVSLPKTEVLIIRQVAAKCAAEIANNMQEFKDVAGEIERWILRE
jgi:hypothetical protein